MTEQSLKWRSHLPNLLTEIVENNPSAWALRIPILLTREILVEVAHRAIELNDPKLNVLMLRLAMYDVPVDQISEQITAQESRPSFYQYQVERHNAGFGWLPVDFHIDASNDADALKQFTDKFKGEEGVRLMRCPVHDWKQIK